MATGAEPLPAQDAAVDGMIFVEKINQGVYRILNNTGATISQYDYVLIHGFLGVAYQEAVDGAYFDLLVDDEVEMHAEDLTTGADTFGTLYQTVYFNSDDGSFADLPGYGIAVGKLSKVKDADGVIKFFNLTKGLPLGGEVSTIELEVDADASAGITFPLGFDYKILDVVAYSTATVTSATVTLSDGTSAITNAIDIDTIGTRFGATTIDETKNTIIDPEVLTVTTVSAADRCRLLLTIKAV